MNPERCYLIEVKFVPIPFRLGDLVRRLVGAGDARIVDEDVQTSETLHHLADNRRHFCFACRYFPAQSLRIAHLRRAGGGSIIMPSIYGLVGGADIPPYHAAKGAVRLMTKTDAMIYAADRIRVKAKLGIGVVLSDIEMAGTMDGFGLAHWICPNRSDLKVILAGSAAHAAQQAGDLCASGPELAKPDDHALVVHRITRLLAAKSAG